MVGAVPALVQGAPLDEGGVAEDLAHCGGEGLGSVDDHEQPPVGAEPSIDEVGQQLGDDGLVLAVSQPQAHGHLGAVGADGQGHHAAVLGEVHAVEHQRHHVQVGQVTGHELIECLLRLSHEPPRHRGLGGRAGLGLDLGAHRLVGRPVAAAGEAGQHALHDHGRQHVVVGEGGVGVELDLGAPGWCGPGGAAP